MKRIVTFLSFGIAGMGLFGCPIYGDSGDYRYCDMAGCYRCPDQSHSQCTPLQCGTSNDCPNGYTCNNGACVSGGCSQPSDCPNGSVCGQDGACHAGDCSTLGCVKGYICKVANGTGMCVADQTSDAGMDSGPPPECMADSDCTNKKGAGAKCLNGTCVGAQDVCVDGTQCQNGYQCVQGVCTPPCSGTKPCPVGYSCSPQNVCTGNPTPCSNSSMCMNGTVCSQGHCVPPCGNGCGMGLVCVGGGCIPDQKPQFVCTTEGVQDVCKMGSICLRHNCYIACSADAGADAGQCANADQFKICKSVTTMSGTYAVCGSNTNLGSECDPSQMKNCTNNGICIDGYCH